MRAMGLGRKFEVFAVLLLDDVVIGRTKVAPSSRNPVWGAHLRQTFVFPVRCPLEGTGGGRHPATSAVVRLMDSNTTTTDKIVGEVRLDWATLMQASLKSYALQEPPEALQSRTLGCMHMKAMVGPGVKGKLQLLLQQHKLHVVDVLGAYGLAAGDANGLSDPFIEVVAAKSDRHVITDHRSNTLAPSFHHRVVFSRSLSVVKSGGHDTKRMNQWRRRKVGDSHS